MLLNRESHLQFHVFTWVEKGKDIKIKIKISKKLNKIIYNKNKIIKKMETLKWLNNNS